MIISGGIFARWLVGLIVGLVATPKIDCAALCSSMLLHIITRTQCLASDRRLDSQCALSISSQTHCVLCPVERLLL
uniref:Secreted protein n=1 Tax=Ascaris lumbricoides TaxID=6252 RepID=A0A0M3IHU6_ASCLU